jgi:thymidylate synthase
MNIFGFTQFNKEIIAAEVEKRSGKPVKLGRLKWQADSYEIYGKDIKQAKEMLFDRVEEMDFENRVFNFNDPFIREMYDSAESMVINKIEAFDKSH